MGKFNVTDNRGSRTVSPIRTETTPTLVTHEGAPGFARDAKGELFLLAVSNMVGEDTFYESGQNRDSRFASLVHQVAVADPAWMLGFLGWLRGEGNMRSASLVGAAEAVHARLAVDQYIEQAGHVTVNVSGWNRQMVAAVLQRADEPGEFLAYWTKTFGRALPQPVKRGVADAAVRLYSEFSLLKYDTASHGFRFGDVLDLCHPTPECARQGWLFEYALDRRHGRDNEIPEALKMVQLNGALRRSVAANDWESLLIPEMLRKAGMTWEDALSLAGSKVDKAKLWEALIPSMGYMALLRNLRNFDEAGVSNEVAATVAARLADPEQVARSRQFPYRFLAAYTNVPSVRWAHALDQALDASLANVPVLPGKTLVLVDTSASMTTAAFSARSKMTPAMAAAVFGVVLAKRCGADLFGFADGVFRHELRKGASAIAEIANFTARTGEVGHGTNIAQSLRATWKGHDRVFIISDMQTMDRGVGEAVPSTVKLYGFNLGGYQAAAFAAGVGNRHEFGGLTDATFRMVPLLERGASAAWPWENTGS